MLERVVFARGVWFSRHRPDQSCWCRPTLREQGRFIYCLHRDVAINRDRRERAFISGHLQAPM